MSCDEEEELRILRADPLNGTSHVPMPEFVFEAHERRADDLEQDRARWFLLQNPDLHGTVPPVCEAWRNGDQCPRNWWDCPHMHFEDRPYAPDDDDRQRAHIEWNRDDKVKWQKKPVVCTKWWLGRCYSRWWDCKALHVCDLSLREVCHFYARGADCCTNPDCTFLHLTPEQQILCVAYARGFCPDGDRCSSTHRRLGADQRDRIALHVADAQASRRADASRRAQQARRNAAIATPDQRKRSWSHANGRRAPRSVKRARW